jgi:hypothetical protein
MSTRAKGLLTTAMVVIVVLAAGASGASAQEFIYKVAGSKLEAGKTKEVKGSGTTFTLKGEVPPTKVEVQCAMKLAAGSKIKGGKPGTSEDTIELTGCSVLTPSGCTSVTVNPVKAKGEIVVLKPSGKLGLLFTPLIAGEPLTVVKFTGCLGEAAPEVTGSLAAQESPEGEEKEKGKLIFPTTAVKKVETTEKKEKAVGLEFAGAAGTLSGESSVELVSKEIFGIF